MKKIVTTIILVISLTSFAKEYNKILLTHAFLHTGNGVTQEDALVGIENGEISLIRNTYAYTIDPAEWDTIIDLKGKHIYPGFVAPNSTLGLTEIDAVRATRDFDEVGTLNPHIRSQIAYNVESRVISTVRTNGVLLTQATPRGGVISGTSSVMALNGWNWQDATISADDGIHVNWPNAITIGNEKEDEKKKQDEYTKAKREITDFFEQAKAYTEIKNPETKDLRFEAMRECFEGDKRVYFHANELQQLLDIIEFSQKYNLPFPVIVGGYDSHLITRQLADAKIPVMLVRLHELPDNEEDAVNLVYKLPFLLMQGGVKFCLQNEGDMEAMNSRNIPFLAGTAKAYGLTDEQAVSAVTLWSCEIMGIEKNYGSIEKGKSATLFVSEGNALDMSTNQVILAMINGKFVPMENFQSELYEKYLNR